MTDHSSSLDPHIDRAAAISQLHELNNALGALVLAATQLRASGPSGPLGNELERLEQFALEAGAASRALRKVLG